MRKIEATRQKREVSCLSQSRTTLFSDLTPSAKRSSYLLGCVQRILPFLSLSVRRQDGRSRLLWIELCSEPLNIITSAFGEFVVSNSRATIGLIEAVIQCRLGRMV